MISKRPTRFRYCTIRSLNKEPKIPASLRSEDWSALVERRAAQLVGYQNAAYAAFLANEPYSRAGLFDTVTVESFDRFVPHADPDFLEKLLVAARDWIARHLRHRESGT